MMSTKAKFVVVSIITLIVTSCAAIYFWSREIHIPEEKKRFEAVLNLYLPENGNQPTGSAYLIFPENEVASLDMSDVFNQYVFGYYNSLHENDKVKYYYQVYAAPENYLTQRGIPPIRQDNVGENFCFYAWHGAQPVMIVGGGTDTWWDRNGCGAITVILPENYELKSDVAAPFGYLDWYGLKDNEFSIFTSASSLSKGFENNRWTIRASWEQGKFDKANTDLYLEIYYRKVG